MKQGLMADTASGLLKQKHPKPEWLKVSAPGGESYLKIKEELRKITWTSPDELRVYTQITVGATFVLGLSIYLIDLFIQYSLMGISNIVRFIFG